MRDPLRRNLLRKGRCCRFLLRRWNLLTFLILLKFRKALSRSCPHMKQSLRLGRTITPRLITPIAMSRCRPNSSVVIGTSRFRLIKSIKLSYHSQYKLEIVTNNFILKPCISHQWLLLNSVQVKHFLDSVKPCCRTSSALVLLVKAVLSFCVRRFSSCYPSATAA